MAAVVVFMAADLEVATADRGRWKQITWMTLRTCVGVPKLNHRRSQGGTMAAVQLQPVMLDESEFHVATVDARANTIAEQHSIRHHDGGAPRLRSSPQLTHDEL